MDKTAGKGSHCHVDFQLKSDGQARQGIGQEQPFARSNPLDSPSSLDVSASLVGRV